VTEQLNVSNSTLRTFKRCRRHWYLAYHLGYSVDPTRQKPVGSAQLGTRVHLALEAHYGYGLDALAALNVAYHLARREHPLYEDQLSSEHGYARAMVSGYLQWVDDEGVDSEHEVIATEEVVQRELTLYDGEPVTLMAKLDQKVRRVSDGAIRFRDFKTVGTLSKAHLLLIDEQMRFYSLLDTLEADETGQRADGGLYNMILRSKRTPKANGPFFKQVEVSYNAHDHQSMMLRVRTVASELKLVDQTLRNGGDHRALAYPNPGDYCSWACPFTLVCPMMDDGSRWEAALQANFVQADPYGYYGTGLMDQVRASLTSEATNGSDG